MIIRALDSNGDVCFGQGRQSYKTGEKAVEQNAKTRLLSYLGDAFWDLEFGMDWWNLNGQRNPQAQANIILAVRSNLAAAYGITSVDSITSKLTPSRRLFLKAEVSDIFSSKNTLTTTV